MIDYRNKILQGNALEVIQQLPDKSMDCCITSPPYWSLRNYGLECETIWDYGIDCEHDFSEFHIKKPKGGSGKNSIISSNANDEIQMKGYNIQSAYCSKCKSWKGQLGLEPNFDLYIKHLCDIFELLSSKIVDTGSLWINLGDTYSFSGSQCKTEKFEKELVSKCLCMIPSRFAIEMCNRGFILRQNIIWHKPSCLPNAVNDRCCVDYENIFHFTKKQKYYYNQQYESVSESYANDKRPNGVLRQRMYDNSKYNNDELYNTVRPKNQSKTYKTTKEEWFASNKKERTMTRIKRTTWSLNSGYFSGSHFAVFPEDLVVTPLLATCPEKVCLKCGKQSYRIDNNRIFDRIPTKEEISEINIGKQILECNCNENRKGIVVDPFIGSGTTAMVAKKFGRDYLGIDISKKYCEMAEERINNFMPLMEFM